MKKDRTHAFREILEQYSLYQPLPSSLRKHMHNMKRRQLRAILKKKAAYGVVPFAATEIYFSMKSRGCPVSMKQSCFAASVLCITAFCIVSGGLLCVLLCIQ